MTFANTNQNQKTITLNEDEVKTLYLLIIEELAIAPDWPENNLNTLESIKKKLESDYNGGNN